MKTLLTLCMVVAVVAGCVTTRTAGKLEVNYGTYEGETVDGKANGQGTWMHPNGEKYVGEWTCNRFNGQGTYTRPDGSKYVGEFKDGYFHGQATWTFPDGTTHSGLWEGGRFIGPSTAQTNALSASGADKKP